MIQNLKTMAFNDLGLSPFLGNLHVFMGQKTWLFPWKKLPDRHGTSATSQAKVNCFSTPHGPGPWAEGKGRLKQQELGTFIGKKWGISAQTICPLRCSIQPLMNIKWNGNIDLSLKFKLSLKNGRFHHWKMGRKSAVINFWLNHWSSSKNAKSLHPASAFSRLEPSIWKNPGWHGSVAAGLTFSATQKSKSGHHPGLNWKMIFKWMFFTVFCSQEALLTLSFRPSLRNSKSRIATSAHHLDFRCRGDAGNWNFNWSVTEFQLFRYI